MSKIPDDAELEFELRTSRDAKLVLLKITAPHEMNSQDLIWALEYYVTLLQKAEKVKQACQGEA